MVHVHSKYYPLTGLHAVRIVTMTTRKERTECGTKL